MTIKKLWKQFAFLALLSGIHSLSVAADLKMNGIASYQELNKEYYVGALFLEEPLKTVEEISAYNKRKQMKLLVTAARWSVRLWQQQWQNNIAINNKIISNDPKLQQDLAFFTSFLKGKLIKGDELVIDFVPGVGTRIKLNNYPVIKTSDDKIFTYLLNTWIGNLPPSREFKSRILSLTLDANTREMVSLLSDNALSQPRINIISQWYEEPKKPLNVAKKSKINETKKGTDLAKQRKQKEEKKSRHKQLEMAKLKKQKTLAKKNQIAKEKQARLKREKLAEKKTCRA